MLPGPAPSGTVYVIALFSITTSNCDPGTQPLFRFSIHQKNRCVKERKRKVREEEEGKKKVSKSRSKKKHIGKVVSQAYV